MSDARSVEELTRRICELEDKLAAQVKIAEKLRAGEARYRRLFDEAPLAYQMLNSEGIIRDVNQAWLVLLGRDREEVIGRRFEDFIAPEYKSYFQEIFECFLTEGVVRAEELELMRKDGVRIPILFEGRISGERGNDDLLTRCLLQDITERKEIEEKTWRQKEFLRHIINSIPHPFYVIDGADYSIVMANDASSTPGETAGTTCHALTHKRDAPCSGDGEICPFEEVKKSGKPVIVEHVHHDREGRPRYFEVHGYPVFDGRGQIVQMIEYTMDITRRKELEKERLDLIGTLQDALGKVKMLSGLLPICASCKRIRDDQGYWNQLETYIKSHSEAQFTHGLCPDCLKKWFANPPQPEESSP